RFADALLHGFRAAILLGGGTRGPSGWLSDGLSGHTLLSAGDGLADRTGRAAAGDGARNIFRSGDVEITCSQLADGAGDRGAPQRVGENFPGASAREPGGDFSRPASRATA